ncbi:MAG: hypothetical protein ACOYL4_09825 [Miltoncostaeaceae bacterium]
MNTASGVVFTWFLGLVFVAGGIVFMLFLDVNNLLYGLPYLVIGALLCYGAFRLQVSVKKKAAAEQAGSAEPPPTT